MATRYYTKDVEEETARLLDALYFLGLEKSPAEGGPAWKLHHGSPTNGNAWRLSYGVGMGPWFLDSSGYLGWTCAEAIETMRRVRATLHYVDRKLS